MGNLHTANKRHKRAIAVAAKPVEAAPAVTAKPKKAVKAKAA